MADKKRCPVCEGSGKAGPLPGAGDDWWFTEQPATLPKGTSDCPKCGGSGVVDVKELGETG